MSRSRSGAWPRLAGAAVTALCLLSTAASLDAQRAGGAGRAGGPPQTPREMAPFDITGTWVSIVTEDWRYRMVVPPKGQVLGVPLNAEGRRLANAWDPAARPSPGDECRAFGAAAIMRVPGRLRIGWADDSTIQIEADAGTQTRRFRFGALQPGFVPQVAGESTWQGQSVAQWEMAPAARGKARQGNLKVMTTGLRAGFLRTNGVPYSASTVLTEYYDSVRQPNGDVWLVVLTEVNDPQYLTMPFVTTTHFKKEPDASKFAPSACE